MGMEDPIPQYTHLVSTIANRYPDMAYLHVTEPRVSGPLDRVLKDVGAHEVSRLVQAFALV